MTKLLSNAVRWQQEVLIAIVLAVLAVVFTLPTLTQWVDPFVSSGHDELLIYREMREYFIEDLPPLERHLPGYPPTILIIHYIAHTLVNIQYGDMHASHAGEVINMVRQWTLLATALSVVLLYLSGTFLVNRTVGLVASAAWFLSPLIALERNTGITEAWLMLFVACAICTFVLSIRQKSLMWSILCCLAGCTTVTTKYSTFPILGLAAAAALWILIHNRRAGFQSIATQVSIIALTAFTLLFIYDGRYLLTVRELGVFFSGGSPAYRDAESLWELLYTVAMQFRLGNQIVLLGCTIAGVFWMLYSTLWQRYAHLMILVTTIFQVVITLFYVIHWAGTNRYLAPSTPLISLLVAIGIVHIGRSISVLIQKLFRFKNMQITTAIAVIPAALYLVNLGNVRLNQYLTNPATARVEHAVATWFMDRNYSGTVLLPDDVYSWLWIYFDQDWSGYKGQLPTWFSGNITSKALTEWAEMHIEYVWLYDRNIRQMETTDQGKEYLNQVTLIRRFETYPNERWSGERVNIYRLAQVNAFESGFGSQLELVGLEDMICTTSDNIVRVGFIPYWQIADTMNDELQMFLHLTPVDSDDIVAQFDAPIAREEDPMREWAVEDNMIVGRPVELTARTNAEGNYIVRLGVYSLTTMQRLLTPSGEEHITICTLTVE